ncbi:MAG: phosphoglucosamine mutase, partial [Candidatus Altiarchaeota archaeon]|nr:phosphoglucosamine mutase [Candidatus Altiarchaeota archaeon]
MSGLFGTSGIRRKFTEFPQGFAKDLGAALGSFERVPVAVGRDTRQSGLALESDFVAGLTSTGCNVSLLGVVPTPTVGVATKDHGVGVVVTASHNPPEYNGFKFFDRYG